MAVRMGEAGFGHKTVTVLHQGMAHIAELGFLAFALAVEAGIGISNGGMGFVRALLAVKIHFAIAALPKRDVSGSMTDHASGCALTMQVTSGVMIL
jgi:hypothetical protein